MDYYRHYGEPYHLQPRIVSHVPAMHMRALHGHHAEDPEEYRRYAILRDLLPTRTASAHAHGDPGAHTGPTSPSTQGRHTRELGFNTRLTRRSHQAHTASSAGVPQRAFEHRNRRMVPPNFGQDRHSREYAAERIPISTHQESRTRQGVPKEANHRRNSGPVHSQDVDRASSSDISTPNETSVDVVEDKTATAAGIPFGLGFGKVMRSQRVEPGMDAFLTNLVRNVAYLRDVYCNALIAYKRASGGVRFACLFACFCEALFLGETFFLSNNLSNNGWFADCLNTD